MAINFLTLLFLILLVFFFGWLTRWSWRASNPFVKWIGAGLGGLLTLLFLRVTVVGLNGVYKYYNPPSNAVRDIKVEGPAEYIARGSISRPPFVCSATPSLQISQ